jgi:hypothetical protein
MGEEEVEVSYIDPKSGLVEELVNAVDKQETSSPHFEYVQVTGSPEVMAEFERIIAEVEAEMAAEDAAWHSSGGKK